MSGGSGDGNSAKSPVSGKSSSAEKTRNVGTINEAFVAEDGIEEAENKEVRTVKQI